VGISPVGVLNLGRSSEGVIGCCKGGGDVEGGLPSGGHDEAVGSQGLGRAEGAVVVKGQEVMCVCVGGGCGGCGGEWDALIPAIIDGYAHKFVRTHTLIHSCEYMCVHTCVCIWAYIIYVCVYICVHVCVYVCVYTTTHHHLLLLLPSPPPSPPPAQQGRTSAPNMKRRQSPPIPPRQCTPPSLSAGAHTRVVRAGGGWGVGGKHLPQTISTSATLSSAKFDYLSPLGAGGEWRGWAEAGGRDGETGGGLGLGGEAMGPLGRVDPTVALLVTRLEAAVCNVCV
jgi:hypothetical protein